MKIMKKSALLCLAILLVLAMVACGSTEIEVKADKATASPGDTVTLSAILGGQDASDAVYEITEGDDIATLDGNKLTISESAVDGDVIKVKAEARGFESDEISIKVEIPVESIVISANGAANLLSGSSVILNAALSPANAGGEISWVIVEGEDVCAISGNVLVVNQNAATGAVIKVMATCGDIESNVLSFTVGYPLTGIEAEIAGSANVEADTSRALSVTITPANATGADIEWVFITGEDYATITNNILSVDASAPVGSTISFKAVCGNIESDVITVTVGVPITEINIEAIGSTTVVKGNTVTMSETITPSNASAVGITWQIVEGENYATITNKTLVVNANAPTGANIKVKAVSGSVESNVLTFTVAPTQEEINNSRYLMSFDDDNITLDKNGLSNPVLVIDIYNYNFESVSGLDIVYEVVSGAEFLQITPNGYNCSLTALGHGVATVKATIRDTDVSATSTVNVVVPPEAIVIPEVFRERPGYSYSFSMIDPKTNAAELLPFIVAVSGEKACGDVKYTFVHADGTGGNDVATVEGGYITFHKTGEVILTVTSDSGSRVETSVSYRFNINAGYNVSTFEELRLLGEDASYNGSLPINVVVLEKTVGADGNDYGFNLVPAVALKAQSEQTFDEIISSVNKIAFTNKGLYINGNRHKIDASNMRIPTSDELNAHKAQGGSWDNHSALLGVFPYDDGSVASDKLGTYRVYMYDFEVVGNCPMTLDANTSNPSGVYRIGILVGGYDSDSIRANYYLTMENVNVSKTNIGMRLLHIVDGKVKGTFVNDCFSNGLEIGGSIMTLENMVYGACGATGIELVPQDSGTAGVNRNQHQQITYAGSVNIEFYNNGETEYLSNKLIMGLTITDIIEASYASSGLTDAQIMHFKNADGFVFVTFMLHDVEGGQANQSELIYPGFQSGGVINAKDLPTDGTVDTTHEYIELDVAAFGYNAGKAYLYNLMYQP